GVPGAQLANGAEGEPGYLAALNHFSGNLVAGRGVLVAAVVATTAAAVGFGVLRPSTRRAALSLGIVLAVMYGVVGQDVGTILTGQGTDPGTAPLLVLLALTLWPSARERQPTTDDQRVVRNATGSAPVAAGSVGAARPEPTPVRVGGS